MKKSQIGESRAHRFFSGKGFYVALAASLVAVGGAAWLGVNSAIGQLENSDPRVDDTPSQEAKQDEWSLPSEYQAAAPQKGVPATSSQPPASSVPEEKPQTEQSAGAVEQGYILPLKGEILNAYSGDKVVKSKTLDDWMMHTGVDIAAEVSTPVKAMSAGTVLEVNNDAMWGTTVTIEHADGLQSYYANLKSAVNVAPGQKVTMGAVIGEVGETADIEHAEASHLHFGVKRDGEWIDPLSIAQ